MDLLGVGPLELVFILLIIFLVLGPDDLAATGKKIGRFLNTARKSEFWQGVTEISKEVRSLPNTLMREAQLEETKKELEKDLNEVRQVAKEFDVDQAQQIQQELKKDAQAHNRIDPREVADAADEPMQPAAPEAEKAKPAEPAPEAAAPEAASAPEGEVEPTTEEDKD